MRDTSCRGPFLQSPRDVSGPESLSKISNVTITELLYCGIYILYSIFIIWTEVSFIQEVFRRLHFPVFTDTDKVEMALRARKLFPGLSRNGP